MQRVIDFDLFDGKGIFTVRIEFIQQTDNPMHEAIELIKAHEKYKDNVHYWWWVK